jgi:signal transduction histidine kinase
MNRRYDPFFVFGPALAVCIFAMDISLELGVAGGVLYQALILICLPRGGARHLPYATITAVGLLLIGWQLSPDGSETWKVIFNRSLSMVTITATALAVGLKHRGAARLELEREARLNAEREQAEQAELARLGEMASLVAHEVKNAMGGIRGAVQVISRDFPGGSTGESGARRINNRIDSLVGWIEQVLRYSRPFQLDLKQVDAELLVQGTVSQFRDDGALRDTSIAIDVPPQPLPISGDPELLRRALLNLLLNAAQANGGGEIRVTVRPVGTDWCEISVADDGPGIPHELRDKVLDPFFTTRTSGTGLGLPLVQKTAASHGGRVDLDHPGEGGTVVRLRLPRFTA